MTTIVKITHTDSGSETVLGYRITILGGDQDVLLQPLGAGQSVNLELDAGHEIVVREFFADEANAIDAEDDDGGEDA